MYYIINVANPTLWIVIGVIALLLFGGQKIPEMMKGLGGGMKAFKEGMNEEAPKDDELRKEKEREAEIRRRVEEEMRKGN